MNETIIDRRSVKGPYDLLKGQIIVDTAKHGRLFITEGFGGGSLGGQSVRWRHGLVVKIKPDDTFDTLDEMINPACTVLDRALAAMDKERLLQEWNGYAIEKFVETVLKQQGESSCQ